MANTILSRFEETRPDSSVVRKDVDYDPISADSPRETPNSRNLLSDPNYIVTIRGGTIDSKNKYSDVIGSTRNK